MPIRPSTINSARIERTFFSRAVTGNGIGKVVADRRVPDGETAGNLVQNRFVRDIIPQKIADVADEELIAWPQL